MPKLHQVLALAKTRKSQAKLLGDRLYQQLQKHQLASGGYGTYEPATETDERLPPESQRVQVDAEKLLRAYTASQTPAWDITATQDEANMGARADVTVGDVTLLGEVPVTTLIFLEKQLVDLRTVINAAPVLDAAESWDRDSETGLWRTEPVTRDRTRKVTEAVIVVPASDKFPAQWTEQSRDVIAGTWSRVKVSGALPETRKELLLRRVTDLLEAVKSAREEANGIDVDDVNIADRVFTWLLAG